MVNRAISSAKRHGIILEQGTPNKADGNCALESAILNLKIVIVSLTGYLFPLMIIEEYG